MSTTLAKPETVQRKWYILDAAAVSYTHLRVGSFMVAS